MKKILSVVIILIVIMLGSYIFNLQNDNEKDNTNTINNIGENKEITQQSNVVYANEITNDIVVNEIENTTSSETLEESPKTSEQKAIDIAKKDWGNDSNVNFSVQGMDGNGNYIVVVSDSSTVSLAFYSVNIKNETFTKREMN